MYDNVSYSATLEYDRLNRIRSFCENGATGSGCQSFHYIGDSDWLSYVSQYNTVLQRYLYVNGRPLRVDIRYISTLYPNYYRYNARGDAAATVQQNGDGGASWTNYGAWGDIGSGGAGYYAWNAAWGYMQFPANLNFNLHGGYDMGLYFAHGRWYNQDTGLWLSPNEKGDYLYGGDGQDPVNVGFVDAFPCDGGLSFLQGWFPLCDPTPTPSPSPIPPSPVPPSPSPLPR